MVKLRSAYFCNLKLLLMWLVIFGHWIEPRIGADPELHQLYRLIYLFHMPLFAFLSGLFLRSSRGCLGQLRRMLPLSLLCQSGAVLLGLTPWHTPWWILWYLLSLSCWLPAAALLLKLRRGKWLILALAFLAGCLAGSADWIGRPFSLSRTIVFFPWFWLGVLLPPGLPWHRLRFPALIAAALLRPEMSAVTLYHAAPCDPLVRLECYVCALALGALVLGWCPRRRFPWTRAGADTLPAYLLHAPAVRLLGAAPYPALTTTFLLYCIYKLTQWNQPYGIIGKEECPCGALKNSIPPRASRSTGSSSP